MTNNTIPNVPRELEPCPFCGGKAHAIAENAATRQPEVVMCLACLGEIEGAGAIDKWNARTLSAPSPAGVDGLEVVAQVVIDPNGSNKRVIFHSTKALHELPVWTKLSVTADAQAIIDELKEGAHKDGLLRVRYAAKIERQAQRIGELEGLLRAIGEAGRQLSNAAYNLAQREGHELTKCECALLSSLRKQWDAALYSGKDGE